LEKATIQPVVKPVESSDKLDEAEGEDESKPDSGQTTLF